MLHLQSETSAAWIQAAVADIDAVLLDHAHCEKKAASTAINMLFRYPHHTPMLRPLSALAREELEHFELVLDHLDRRGVQFCRQKPSAYAGKLMEHVRREEPDRLLDMLLACAIIEARSCERMRCLAENLPQPELVELYRGLLASEARHHMLYVDLAHEIFPDAPVTARLDTLMACEAAILADPDPTVRMHS